MASWVNDFPPKYIAEVNKSWTPLGTWGVPLHIFAAMVGQRGLQAAFSSKTHVLGGLGLFFEENGLCEARYVSKIGKVHTPRIQQIVFLKGWHLSRTLSQRLVKPFPNNLSKTAAIPAILLQKCGGHKPSGWAGGFKTGFLQIKCAGLTGKIIFCTKSIETILRHFLVTMVTMFLVSHTSNPEKKFLALRQA